MTHLGGLGLSTDGEGLYRHLVERGPRAREELCSDGTLDERTLESAVDELVAAGLVGMAGEQLTPLPPFEALQTRASAHLQAALEAQESSYHLGEWWSRTSTRADYIDIIQGHAACRSAQIRIHEEARTEVLALCPVPRAPLQLVEDPHATQDEPEMVPQGLTALERGVAYRVVYGAEMMQDPSGRRAVSRGLHAGERVRLHPEVPMHLTIVDARVALIVYAMGWREHKHCVLVRSSGLLDTLSSLFEMIWHQAAPLRDPDSTAPTVVDDQDRRMLLYLNSGVTDDAIARELGVSGRTVARRIGRLQELLGARTRFQLGAQATRRGLL